MTSQSGYIGAPNIPRLAMVRMVRVDRVANPYRSNQHTRAMPRAAYTFPTVFLSQSLTNAPNRLDGMKNRRRGVIAAGGLRMRFTDGFRLRSRNETNDMDHQPKRTAS